MKKSTLRIIYVAIGTIALILGVIGAFLPVLPTTPFLLVTAYCYARGSERFHNWFTSTKIYKKYLENYVQTKSMTLKAKIILISSVSVVMLISAYFTNNLYMWIVCLAVILGHIVYFGFVIKTIKR